MAAPLTDAERLARLRLSRTDRVGPITFLDLIALAGSAREALTALPDLARRKVTLFSEAAAQAEIDALAKIAGRLIVWGDPEYPEPLAAIADPPPVLNLLGDPDLISRSCVAMVGARNASALGKRFARDFAKNLTASGQVVVSGLARGIDAAAHQGALAHGTVAVVGGGVDVVYPPENKDLQARIADSGALLSEQPLGTVPRGCHFPRRNRIISGLSRGVVVVEATPRSGSLITARMAAEQGRDVFAVPGSPMDPRHKGTNALIRDGAILTETVDDVLAVIAPAVPRRIQPPETLGEAAQTPSAALVSIADSDRDQVRRLLGPDPVAVDELVRQCQLTPSQVLTILLELELAGAVRRHGGGRVSLELTIT